MIKKIMMGLILLLSLSSNAMAENLDSLYATTLLKTGEQAPNFTLPTIKGETFSLETLKGKFVVIDFWASWCSDCRRITPEIETIATEYANKNVVVVGVSFDTNKEAWQNYVYRDGEPKHEIHVSNLQKMKDSAIAKAYGIKWIPSLYLLDTTGKVLISTVEIQKIKDALKQITTQM